MDLMGTVDGSAILRAPVEGTVVSTRVSGWVRSRNYIVSKLVYFNFFTGRIQYTVYIPRTPMTSIFEGEPPKTRPFPIKTRVIWVLGKVIIIYLLSTRRTSQVPGGWEYVDLWSYP